MENQKLIWKEFPENPKYKVSNHGNVLSPNGNMLTPKPNNIGYVKVWIYSHTNSIGVQIGRFYSVHRMVAITFIPNPENLPEVNHKDGVKTHNYESNLEWITHRDNIIHSFKTRVMPSGKDHWNYGKTYSEEQKQAMADAKKGEKHPKFKGWYCKDGQKYASSYIASIATGEVGRTIVRQAKAKSNGWTFLPKLKDNALNIGIELSDFISPTQVQVPVPNDPSGSDFQDPFI